MIIIFSPSDSVPAIPVSQQWESESFDGTYFLPADELRSEGWKKLMSQHLRAVPDERLSSRS